MTTKPVMIDSDLFAIAERKASDCGTPVLVIVRELLRQWIANDDRIQEARAQMRRRFANLVWKFSVGKRDDREQRHARR